MKLTKVEIASMLYVLSLIVAAIRVGMVFGFWGNFRGYQDLAHIYVGGLFGAALAGQGRHYWVMAWGLTIVEVIAAGITIAGKLL